jgi:hypothetical protein
MAFEPAFLRDLAAFRAELARVRDAGAWAAFKARWFADQPWPPRPESEVAAARPDAPVELGGRRFVRAPPFGHDLSAEGRHQYFAALQAGFAAVFPGQVPGPGTPVRLFCPACEMWSDEPGDPACPGCGRELLRMRLAPPR